MPQITIDTGMDTKPVWNGIKDINSALRSLRSYVSQTGKQMNASVVGYAKAMQANADASREVDARVQELTEAYKNLVQQMNEMADTKISTEEYTDLLKEMSAVSQKLRSLREDQQRLRDLGKDIVPTKAFKENENAINSNIRKIDQLEKKAQLAAKRAEDLQKQASSTTTQLNTEVAKHNDLRAKRDDAISKGQATDVDKYIAQMAESKQKIQEYRKELSSIIREQDKQYESLGRTTEQIEQLAVEQDKLKDIRQQLIDTGADTTESEVMRRNQYEIQKTIEKLRELHQTKKDMEDNGEAFINGNETEEYANLAKREAELRKEYDSIVSKAQKDTRPLHIKEWEQMSTITSTVSEGFSRVLYAAQMAGHAITHPFEALNRLIPVVLSGLGQLAQKALDVAMSFARWAINNIVNGVKRLASAALNAAAGLARMVGSAVVSFLQRLANAAKNAAVQLARVAGKAVITGLKGIGSLAAQAGKAILGIGKSAKKSNNGLGQAVKMLVRYGFGVRSVFMLVRRLRSALVDAFKNMAKGVPEVNKAISALSASLGMLKNSMATAFQPILNAIAPILVQFMDMLSEAMTKVGMFFAALVGQDYVYKATKAQFDYAKSLDKTKKSAKEAENQLASFDKLNILKAPNNSSSGTGTDTNAADAGKFVKTPLESGIKEFVDTLKRMFQGGEFDEIGKILAEKFNKFISSIDWNGYAVKIGNLVNGLVEFYNAFMETMNWQNIGQNIADAINGLVDTIDWEALGRAFSQKINAIFGIITGLVDRINAENLGAAMSNALWGFLGNIKWEEIGSTIGTGITKIANSITKFATEFPWEDFATEVAQGANALFSKITPSSVGGALVGIINGGFKFLLRFLQIFKFEEHGQALQKGIKTFVEGIDTDVIGEALKTAIIGILSYVTPAIEDEETWTLAGTKLADMLNKLFGVDQDGETVWTKLEKAITGLASGVIASLTGFVSEFKWGENGEKFRQGVLKLIENFPAGPLGHLINISIKGVLDGMGPTISDPKVWSELGTKLGTGLNEMLGDKETWQKAGEVANEMMNGVLTFGENFLTTFDEKTAADNIKAALDEIKWGEIATKLWNTAKLAFKKAGNFLDVLFGDFDADKYKLVKGKLDYPEELANSVVGDESLGTKIGNKIRKALGKIPWKSIGEELWNSAKAIGTNIEDFLVSVLGITPNEVNDAGGKIKAIGSKVGTTVGRALSQIPWSTVLKDAKDFFLSALGDMFNELANPDNGQGPILLKIAGVIAGLNVGIPLLLNGLKATITKTMASTAASIGVAGLAIFDAIVIAYDIKKLNEIADGYSDVVDAHKERIKHSLDTYSQFIASGNKEAADEYAKLVAGIDTTNMDSETAIRKLRTALVKEAEKTYGVFIDTIGKGNDALVEIAERRADETGVSLSTAYLQAGQSVPDAFWTGVKERASQSDKIAPIFNQAMDVVFNAADPETKGSSSAEQFYSGIRNILLAGDPEIVSALEDIFTPAELEALRSGDMTLTNFINAFTEGTSTVGGDATEEFGRFVTSLLDYSETAEQSATNTTQSWFSSLIQTTLEKQGDAEDAVDKAFDEIWGVINPDGNGEIAAWGYMQTFLDTILDEEGNVREGFEDVWDRIMDGADIDGDGEIDGKEFMRGLVNGMSGEEDETKTKLVGIIDSVLKYVQHSPEGLESHSPSKRAERYGKDFMLGFQNGTQEEQSSVSSTLLDIFTNIANSGKSGLESVDISEPFDNEWSDISNSLNTNLSTMEGDLSGSMTDMKGTTTSGVQQQTKPFYDEWKAVIWIVRQSLGTISSELMTSMRDMGLTVHQGMFSVGEAMSRGINDIAYSVRGVNWWSVGDYIVAGIQDGVQDNWKWLNRTVWNLAVSLYNTACRALGIHSPSKLFREGVGQMIGLGVAEGFEDTEPTIMNSVTDVADAMVDKMASTDMKFDVDTETALSSFSDKIADSFATLLDRLQAIADSVTFRTPDVAAGTVVPYNVAAKVGGDSTGLVEALEVSNDDLASVIIQATNNAAVAIVDAIQRHGGINNPNVSAQTSAIIDEINRRTRANGASPILM